MPGYFCCTDHSTVLLEKSPPSPPGNGVFDEAGKHSDRSPFPKGFRVPLPSEEGGVTRPREYKGREGKLLPSSPPCTPEDRAPLPGCVDPLVGAVGPCRGEREREINPPPLLLLKAGIGPRLKARVPPRGSSEPPF